MTEIDKPTDRRRLLRRAGTLAAGVAGAGVAAAVVATPAGADSHRLLTTVSSNTIVPIFPTRAVDTRSAATRTRIINPWVLDSAGRLSKNQTMDVDLSDLAFFPDAVLLNATVTGQTTAGYLTVFPWLGTRPGIASLNYSPNQNLTNLVFTAYGHDAGTSPASGVSVFTSQLTHVILDVVGFVIGDGAVNPAVLPERRAPATRKTKPRWE
jgi:hypothetical protein